MVQVWNGELGGWMVVGGSTGLMDKFLALWSFSWLDFELSVISTGASCRMHRASCRMHSFPDKWDQGLEKDNSDGEMVYQRCIQLVHVPFSSLALLQSAMHSKEFNFSVLVFLFFLFFFFKRQLGASRRFSPSLLSLGTSKGRFLPRDLLLYSFFLILF